MDKETKRFVWKLFWFVIQIAICITVVFVMGESWLYGEITFGQLAFLFFMLAHYLLTFQVGSLLKTQNFLDSLGRFLGGGIRTALFFMTLSEGGLTLSSVFGGLGWVFGEFMILIAPLVDYADKMQRQNQGGLPKPGKKPMSGPFRYANFLVIGAFILWRSGIVEKLLGA